MFKKLLATACLLTIVLSLAGMSQTGRQEQKGPKSSAANESCDGALNIAPTKSMTFMRKRRPRNDNKSDSKNDSKTDSKTRNDNR